jgi:hypothetical protein
MLPFHLLKGSQAMWMKLSPLSHLYLQVAAEAWTKVDLRFSATAILSAIIVWNMAQVIQNSTPRRELIAIMSYCELPLFWRIPHYSHSPQPGIHGTVLTLYLSSVSVCRFDLKHISTDLSTPSGCLCLARFWSHYHHWPVPLHHSPDPA